MPHFKKAIEIKPDYAEAYENLSTIYFQAGDLTAAVSSLQEALKIKPAYADAHFNLGVVLRETGDLTGSIAHFEETLRIRPADAGALRELGSTLLRQGRAGDAIVRLEQALAINSRHIEALADLGNAYLQVGQPGNAIVQFQRALALRPTDLVTLNNLAWILAASPQASVRDGKKAVELAYRARELTRGADPNVLRTLSAAYAETGQFHEAAATALQALQITADRSPLADTLRKELALYQSRKALP
jgi:tetratricopeptide (TPR) repeat protein